MGILFKKGVKADQKIIILIFIVISCFGYHGYMLSYFIPKNIVYYFSTIISLPTALFFLFKFKNSHPKFKDKKFPKPLSFYLVIYPLTFLLFWSSFTYSIPGYISKFIAVPYKKEHIVGKKSVSCQRKCNYNLDFVELSPILKHSVKVDKSFFDKIVIGDTLLVKGLESKLGIEVFELVQILRIKKAK